VRAGERQRRCEAEVLGGRRHRRHQHHRIVCRPPDGVLQRLVEAVAIVLEPAQHIGEEGAVEAAALELARQVHPVVERLQAAQPLVRRVRPAERGVVDRAMRQEAQQVQLLGHRSPLVRQRGARDAGDPDPQFK
jgi:hypothetical protein